MAPAVFNTDVVEHLGQAGSIPVRLRHSPGVHSATPAVTARTTPHPAAIGAGPTGRPAAPSASAIDPRSRVDPLQDRPTPRDPTADPHARALLGKVRELRGRTPNVYRAIGDLTVGMSNMINRFHATFHTDVDDTASLLGAVCPVRSPPSPGGSFSDNP